jgi:hypothetical protein
MKKRYLIILASCVLSSCQGAPGTMSASSAPPASVVPHAAAQARPSVGRASWMEPDAKKKELMYVSDPINWDIAVYDYHSRTQVGMLSTGLDYPEGMCVDKNGNVWVANSGAYNMLEFPHGAKTAIATLDDNSYEPVSCSINPKNGDLAVGNILYFREGLEGNVTIFKGAAGTGTAYGVAAMYSYYFVGYDGNGNLFFDGTNSQPGTNGQFEYAELPSGSSTPHSLTLAGGSVSFPGNVQWDGKEIAVGDQSNAVIYQTSGSQIVGQTPLTGSSDVVGYFIKGKTVIGPDAGNDRVEFFHYPAGGKAYETITRPAQPTAVVISR